jgi:hypothetical protein
MVRALPLAVVMALLVTSSAFAQHTTTTVRARAKQAWKDGDLEAAAKDFRRLAFAGDRGALKKLRAKQKKDVKALVAKAKRADSRAAAVELLQQAHAIDPFSKTIRRALKSPFAKQKYVFVGGAYVPKEEAKTLKSGRREKVESRREALGLSKSFTAIRRGPFRFYTDMDMRYGKKVVDQMLAAIDAHLARYVEVMSPVGLRYPSEGLDVVLFNKEKDYLAHTKASGSAGVYIPRQGAGYFFAGSHGFDFPTMLHEMTHQLNDKVLKAGVASPWFEEGIAEYFGAGELTSHCRQLKLGRPERYRLATFRGMLTGSDGHVIPLKPFLGAKTAELSGSYYAQAWALTQFLMEGGLPQGRFIIFDMIMAAKESGLRQARLTGKSVDKILGTYGWDVPSLERTYLAYHRSGCKPVRGLVAAFRK